MRAIYIADDGTRFETEEECLEYEQGCTPEPQWYTQVKGLNVYDQPLNFGDPAFFNRAYMIKCDTPEAVERIREYCAINNWCSDGILTEGTYVWDDNERSWQSLDTIISACQLAITDHQNKITKHRDKICQHENRIVECRQEIAKWKMLEQKLQKA